MVASRYLGRALCVSPYNHEKNIALVDSNVPASERSPNAKWHSCIQNGVPFSHAVSITLKTSTNFSTSDTGNNEDAPRHLPKPCRQR